MWIISGRKVDKFKETGLTFFIGKVLAASADENLFSLHWHEDAKLIHHLGISGKLRNIQ